MPLAMLVLCAFAAAACLLGDCAATNPSGCPGGTPPVQGTVGSLLLQKGSRVAHMSSDEVETSELITATWAGVDGGFDRACRGSSPSDNSDSYYAVQVVGALEECKALCSGACTGIEYKFSTGRCEVWTQEISSSKTVAGFTCLRLTPGNPTTTTTSVSTTGILPGGWESVDGGVNRACRGDSSQDNLNSYYIVVTAASIDQCTAQCSSSATCAGVEYRASSGRCELWSKDIGASIPLDGFQCLRRQTTAPRPPPEGWEQVDGGVNRACRGDSSGDNSNSYYTVVPAASRDQCIVQCSNTAACTGVEYSLKRCELWNRAIGASIPLIGFECLRAAIATTTTTTMTTTTAATTAPPQPAICGGSSALNEFASKAQMEQAGWVFDWADSYDFRPSPGSAGLPADSYWGYKFPGDGEVSLTLQGSGVLTLDYGNSWSEGLVSVYLNGALKDAALPGTRSQTVTFEFSSNDVLMIREAPTAVIVISRISFECPLACSSSAACPNHAPVCVDQVCRECSTDADCSSSEQRCINRECKVPDPFRVVTTEHRMARPMAKAMPWTLMPGSGLCGAECKVPRRMSTMSCGGDRLIVTWTAHVGWEPNPEYGPNGTRKDQGLWQEVTVGHVSEFAVDAAGGTTLLSDQELHDCNDVGNVAASATCDVAAILCRSSKSPRDMAAYDFQGESELQYGKQFGWYVPSQPDPSKDNYRIVDHMYLLEWTSGDRGQTGQPPQAVVHLGKNIGGWNYGHWDVSLNSKSTLYAIALKTTIGPPREDEADFAWGWHEGAVNYAINRNDWSWNRDMGGGWGSGCGHILENRITYNEASGTWVRFYGGDAKDFWSRSMCISTMQDQEWHDVYHIPPSAHAGWHGTGGPFSMVSRGAQGWLGVMSAPDPANPKSKNESVEKLVAGFVEVPLDVAKCADGGCAPKWLNELPAMQGQTDQHGITEQLLGMLNLQNLGPAGENARLLMGWASVRTTGSTGMAGYSDEYYIAEVDEQGKMRSKVQSLNGAGWGEDNVWASVPETGCVAWAFTWNEVMSKPYGNGNFNGDASPGEEEFSDILRLTVVCPK